MKVCMKWFACVNFDWWIISDHLSDIFLANDDVDYGEAAT